ncbi:putative membrane protein YccC [Luteibacter sp. Sphag1AF]|uniref:FUSC family protein n=1 Tax=Luteibacter sp. Sphag1AF TaxID=2587031 RepID=UPI00161FF0E7|nr:FUSC family protein [Luteibacter sp. Sphag1AF]MBB3228262.1 putative membrane protein YccC [Luteibacter sp. Sphag1AF]
MGAPSASEWLYSGKAFIAAMLAFYLALVLQLPNPYWSFATVYIVSHPLSGATRSKAVYRALGTLIGAAMAVVLVPTFAESPLMLVFAIGCWATLSLYLSLRNNRPSAYCFLLASYTTPLVAIPAILAPGSIFDIALARSEEILLGIVCASVVSALLFPSRVSPLFHARVEAVLRDAANWTTTRLADPTHRAPPALRARLLSDVVSLDALITQLSYDSARRGQEDEARQIRVRMTMLIPQVAALSDALAAIDSRRVPRGDGLRDALENTLAWMREGTTADSHTAALLRTKVQDARDAVTLPLLDHALITNALDRLGDLIDLWQDCLVLHDAFNASEPVAPPLSYRAHALGHHARYYDHGMMLIAALSPAMAVVVAGWVWLATSWPGGASGVVMVAVSTAFFAASDNPAAQVGRFLIWETLSILTAGIYLFCILPHITSFAGVAASMAIPLLVVGAFTGRPHLNMGVLLLTSQTISDIAFRNNAAPNFDDFANSSLAMILGLVFALVWTLITRPFGAEIAARRLARANWRGQARLAERVLPGQRLEYTARILDRTAQWLPRLALVTGESLMKMDAVRDMRICLALLDLQALRDRDPAVTPELVSVLKASRAYFLACTEQDAPLPPPVELIARIDGVIARTLANDEPAAKLLIRYRQALSSDFSVAPPDAFLPLLPPTLPTPT